MSNPPDGQAPYPEVDQQPDYPRLEEQVLDFWAADGTFAASVEARAGGDNEYVFYDGPPFANGLPHYGHLLTGFVKDAVPRYQTMRGRRVERRFGWDCHGLPAEMEAEKELEVSGRAGIIEYGIDRFNDYCRALVQRTTDAWERYVTRQARWVDFADDYKTMDLSYMESVMWAFKALWDEGPRSTRASGSCPTAGSARPRCRTSRPARTTPTGPARTRPSRSPSRSTPTTPRPAPAVVRRAAAAAGVDDHPVDAAVEPRPGRRPRHRLRRLRAAGHAHRHRRGAGRGLPRALRRGRAPGHGDRRRAGGAHLPAPVRLLRRPPRRLPGPRPATSSPPTRAPASSTWRPASARRTTDACQAAGIAVVCPVDDRARFTTEVPPYAGRSGLRGQPPHHRRPARRPGRWSRPSPTTTATPTAGAPTPPSSTRP